MKGNTKSTYIIRMMTCIYSQIAFVPLLNCAGKQWLNLCRYNGFQGIVTMTNNHTIMETGQPIEIVPAMEAMV
jgi:hypothetical protein